MDRIAVQLFVLCLFGVATAFALRYSRPPSLGIKSKQGQVTTVEVNEKAKLRCRISGRPRPIVTWYYNNTEIDTQSSPRFEKKRDALVINPAELTDAGMYSMLAKTKNGDRWCNHTLIVVDKSLIQETADKDNFEALQYEMMRKESTLFDLKKENLKLQNEKLKLEIYGLKRG